MYVGMYVGMYDEELVHVIVEADKSHNLPFAGGVIQSESNVRKTKGASGLDPSPRAGGDDTRCPSSAVRQEEGVNAPHLCLLLYLGPSWNGGCPRTLGRAVYFTESNNSHVNLIPRNNA